MLTWNKKEQKRLRLGEIFEYDVKNYDEDEKKDVIDTWQCFFIKVGGLYYLINIDDHQYLFFPYGIKNFLYNGNPRKGSDPFTYEEALRFLKVRNVRTTNKMAYVKEKKMEKVKLAKPYDSVKATGNFDSYYNYSYTSSGFDDNNF